MFYTPRFPFGPGARSFRLCLARNKPVQRESRRGYLQETKSSSSSTIISKKHTIAHQVRPTRWQTDPEQESWALSDLDYLMPPVFLRLMYVYKTNAQVDPEAFTSCLKKSLELTLSQSRTLAGSLEEENGEIRIVKRRESSVPFIVQGSDGNNKFTSFDALKNAGFPPMQLGGRVSVHEETPDPVTSSLAGNQSVSEFRATWIPGGLVLTIGYHHLCMDGTGFAAFIEQWVKNCTALAQHSELPAWDSSNLDRQRLNGNVVPVEDREASTPWPSVSAPSPAGPLVHPVILHFDKFNTERVKTAASSREGWVSSYDAITALLWRVLTRARLAIYIPEPNETSVLAQAVDLRSRFSPPLSHKLQANAITGVLTPPVPVSQVVAPGKLPELALLVRQASKNASVQATMEKVNGVAALKNKTSAMWKGVQPPRFMMGMSDRRTSYAYDADFGFGKPAAVRCWHQPGHPCVIQKVPGCSTGHGDRGTNSRLEVQIPVDVSCLKHFLQDVELLQYAEVVSA